MTRIGTELLFQSKTAISSSEQNKSSTDSKNGPSRDLLSVLVKANIAIDIPNSQRLSDEEVISRMCPLNLSELGIS
jgi:hypothetical protein